MGNEPLNETFGCGLEDGESRRYLTLELLLVYLSYGASALLLMNPANVGSIEYEHLGLMERAYEWLINLCS